MLHKSNYLYTVTPLKILLWAYKHSEINENSHSI